MTTKEYNASIDSFVLEQIENGNTCARHIIRALDAADDHGDTMRRVDKSLQRLKRSGRIVWNEGQRIWSKAPRP